jgi:outer membrane receptor protein involved in Fe transport
MTRDRLLAGAALIALGAGFAAAPAFAQQQSAQAQTAQAQTGLEEIVVTARKREENLMEVPLSISAFTADMIEQTGIENLTDLANQTPGLSFRQAFGRVGTGEGGGSSNRPTMRGQSNIIGVPNMGFFVDGVYVSGNITSYQLDNVERIEVIRGPQAALYGRGTFAGAMNFITRKPGDELAGKIEATVGEYDRYEVTGYINGPIIDGRLSGEISGRYYSFAGDYVNRASGKREGGEETSRNVGTKLYFTPSDDLEFELNAAWSRDVDGFFPSAYSGVNCGLPNIIGTVGTTPRSSNRRRGYYCGEVDVPDTYFARHDVHEALGLDGVNRNTWRSSLKATYDVNDWTLTAIGAFNKFRNAQGFDSGFELGEANGRPQGLNHTQDRRQDWSVEGRIQSPEDNRVKGLVGTYYYRQDDGEGYRGVFTLPAAPAVIPFRPAVDLVPSSPYGTPLPVVIAIPNTVRFLKALTKNDSAVRNWSVFGLMEFEVSEELTITAEGRYQTDKIISDQLAENPTNVLLKESFKKFLPRATALYKVTDNWNVFANVAKGNKPGGFNVLPTDADAASRTFFEQNYQTFDEESAWTYELGLKGTNEDRTLSINSSFYWIDWSDQQLTQTYLYRRAIPAPPAPPPVPLDTTSTATLNAGKTRIRGLEFDVNAKPSDNLDLRLAYSLTDGKFRDFIDAETEDIYDTDGRVGAFNLAPNDPNGQTRGQRIPYSPKHQIILSGTFRQPVSGDWEGFVRSDLTYESRRFDQVHNLAHTGDSYTWNLRTGIEDEATTLTLYVNNVLNDDTASFLTRLVDATRPLQIPSRADPTVFQTTTFRNILAGFPRKRAFGVTASHKF